MKKEHEDELGCLKRHEKWLQKLKEARREWRLSWKLEVNGGGSNGKWAVGVAWSADPADQAEVQKLEKTKELSRCSPLCEVHSHNVQESTAQLMRMVEARRRHYRNVLREVSQANGSDLFVHVSSVIIEIFQSC